MTTTTQSVRKAVTKGIETVYCRAYLSSNQNDLNGNSWNKITLNAVDSDNGTNFVIASNKFIAPVTGLYEIIASIEYTSVIADKRYYVGIYKNGNSVREVPVQASIAENISANCVDQLFLKADDYIELYGNPQVGGGVNSVDAVSGNKATILIVRLVTKEGVRQ